MRSARQIAVTLSLCGIVMLTGCEGKDPEFKALKAELEDAKRSFAEVEEELLPLREFYAASQAREKELQTKLKEAQISAGRLQIQKQSLDQKFKQQEERLGTILEDVESAHKKHQSELETLRQEFEEYKRKFRISLRLRAPGTELPDLEYAGQSYTTPVVVCATPVALEIRHEDGIAILDFAYLSNQLRKRFGYHPGDAAEYAKFQQGNKVDNLVNQIAAEKEKAQFERNVELRVIYKDWENRMGRIGIQIQRKESEIRSYESNLRRTSPRSSGAARLRNDIERFKRDLLFLKRDRQLLALEEPFNPDAK